MTVAQNYREITHDGFSLKIYCTTTEHAEKHGLKCNNPMFIKEIWVDEEKRNKGNGRKLLEIIEEFAIKNQCDLIFGNIPQDAKFLPQNENKTNVSDRELLKYWFHNKGYSVHVDNYDFHKYLKSVKRLRYYGGIGFSQCSELGNYEVKTEKESKRFSKLSDAKEYYEKISGEKAFWNLKSDELVDAWYEK